MTVNSKGSPTESKDSKDIKDIDSGIRANIYNPPAIDQVPNGEVRKSRYHCHTCGVDTTKTRFHCLKHKSLDVCPHCFHEARFPSTLSSADFIKMEEAAHKTSAQDDWSDQEVLLLLEGIEHFDSEWNKVADHVATRTREECVLKFLQLPIEDKYLEFDGTTVDTKDSKQLPFAHSENPVMSVVAFLASVVTPGVASAAANAALAALSTQDAWTSKGNAEEEPQNSNIEIAAGTALAAAAAKAKMLASLEEREIQQATVQAIEAQMAKIEAKVKVFEEMETVLETERRNLEKERQNIFVDRLQLRKQMAAMAGGTIQPIEIQISEEALLDENGDVQMSEA